MAKFANIPLNPFGTNARTRTTIYIPPVDSHLKPHADQIAKEVRLVESARTEALANRPHKDDRDLDEVQLKVLSRVEEGANLLKQFGANQMNGALARIRGLTPKALDTKLALSAVDVEITQAKVQLRDKLETAREDERLALRRLNKFKRDHERGEREAYYADHPVVPAATLLLLLTIETAANAFLFQKASSLGYTGGFAQALLFGVVNVGLGFFFGFLSLRLLGHLKSRMKALGGLFALILLPVGLMWSLIVANYRQALEANPDANFLDMQRFSSPAAWFHITTAESWALLLLGILIFALAALKGRGGHGGFWDTYWGYKPVHLEYRQADTFYSDLKEELRDGIHGAILKARDDLRAAYKRDEDAVNAIQEIAAQAEERAHEVSDSVGEWANMGAALIARYREENSAVRTDAAPSYFAAPPAIPNLTRNMPSAKPVGSLAMTAKEIFEANAAVLVAAEHRISELLASEADMLLAEIEKVEERADKRADEKWRAQATEQQKPELQLAAA
jgi:hypothetical protein